MSAECQALGPLVFKLISVNYLVISVFLSNTNETLPGNIQPSKVSYGHICVLFHYIVIEEPFKDAPKYYSFTTYLGRRSLTLILFELPVVFVQSWYMLLDIKIARIPI
jgi:hypothetical protein